MREFEAAGMIFRDDIDSRYYVDSRIEEMAKKKLKEAINGKNIPFIFLIEDSGIGKSYILKLLNNKIENGQSTLFIDRPSFSKIDLLKLLYEAKGMKFNKEINFNSLKDELIKECKDIRHTIFIDKAELFNEEQLELIYTLGDTKVMQFVLSMEDEKDSVILNKKNFKPEKKVLINYGKIDGDEVFRYIQSSLISNSYSKIALMFTKKDVKKITMYTKGKLRIIKKFLYVLMNLINYAEINGIKKYQKLHSDLILMAALDLGLIDE